MSTKGRLVVPARIRRRFGIKPGTRIVFLEENGRLILQPVTRKYIHSFRGIFKLRRRANGLTHSAACRIHPS